MSWEFHKAGVTFLVIIDSEHSIFFPWLQSRLNHFSFCLISFLIYHPLHVFSFHQPATMGTKWQELNQSQSLKAVCFRERHFHCADAGLQEEGIFWVFPVSATTWRSSEWDFLPPWRLSQDVWTSQMKYLASSWGCLGLCLKVNWRRHGASIYLRHVTEKDECKPCDPALQLLQPSGENNNWIMNKAVRKSWHQSIFFRKEPGTW